jgi:hypothetical protein
LLALGQKAVMIIDLPPALVDKGDGQLLPGKQLWVGI